MTAVAVAYIPVTVSSGENTPTIPGVYCETGTTVVPGSVAAVAVAAAPGIVITKEVAEDTRSIGNQPDTPASEPAVKLMKMTWPTVGTIALVPRTTV